MASRRDVLKTLGATGAGVAGIGSVEASGVFSGPPGGAPGRGRTELTILHDTHIHGRFGDADETENIENYFGLMDHLATDAEHAMRVGVGDDLASSAFSTVFRGRHVVDAFEAGALGHDTYGNHDFDFGPQTLRNRVAESTFQWVSANVKTPSGDTFGIEQGAKTYDLVDLDGVTVGITGILTPRAREVTNLGDNTVLDPATALADVVPEMRNAGADLVLVLSHVANDLARDIAAEVDGIDAMVGDDAAEVLGAETVNETVLAFVGDGYDHLGELTFDIRGNGTHVHGFEYTLYDVSEAVPALGIQPDEPVEIVADSYRARIDSTVIGRSTVDLNCVTEDLRTEETNMGNFVADAIRNDVGSDVVIQNGGGIRTDTLYPPGEITDLLVQQILPFGNTTVELEVSGATLLEALENGVSEVDSLEGRFPQVSGMSFDWDPSAPAGDRIVAVSIGGSPLDETATYTLGTNGFMAGGGDGYDMLTGATQVESGGTLADIVIQRIKDRTPISPMVEGRIERV